MNYIALNENSGSNHKDIIETRSSLQNIGLLN